MNPRPRHDAARVAELTPEEAQREAVRINELLDKVGLSPSAVTEWWNFAAYPQLDGFTPLQAWNRGEYSRVKRLVELLVSERLAARLASNANLQRRLAEPSSDPALTAKRFRAWLSGASR